MCPDITCKKAECCWFSDVGKTIISTSRSEVMVAAFFASVAVATALYGFLVGYNRRVLGITSVSFVISSSATTVAVKNIADVLETQFNYDFVKTEVGPGQYLAIAAIVLGFLAASFSAVSIWLHWDTALPPIRNWLSLFPAMPIMAPLSLHLVVSIISSVGNNANSHFGYNFAITTVVVWVMHDNESDMGTNGSAVAVFVGGILADVTALAIFTDSSLESYSTLDRSALALTFLNLTFKPFTLVLLVIRFRSSGASAQLLGYPNKQESVSSSIGNRDTSLQPSLYQHERTSNLHHSLSRSPNGDNFKLTGTSNLQPDGLLAKTAKAAVRTPRTHEISEKEPNNAVTDTVVGKLQLKSSSQRNVDTNLGCREDKLGYIDGDQGKLSSANFDAVARLDAASAEGTAKSGGNVTENSGGNVELQNPVEEDRTLRHDIDSDVGKTLSVESEGVFGFGDDDIIYGTSDSHNHHLASFFIDDQIIDLRTSKIYHVLIFVASV